MKRFSKTPLITIGRSVVGGGSPAKPNGTGQQPIRASDRGFMTQIDQHRKWREEEDKAIEEDQQKRYNSNSRIPATHKYNQSASSNGYGMRRRLRVPKSDLDALDFQATMDKSQLAMNFK